MKAFQHMKTLFLFFFISTLLFAQSEIKSSIEIPSLFSDNMVLQQKSSAPFWGKALPQTKISIVPSWGKPSVTTAMADSTWRTAVKTPQAGGPFSITMKIGDSVIVLKNVLIGEVWVCSGQSNMEMPLEGWPPNDTIANSANEIREANFPKIRLFNVKRELATEPRFHCSGAWSECIPESAAKFSATAYFFGKKLFQELKVPIGLIVSAWGGTPVEAWTSEHFITQDKEYADFPAKFAQGRKEYAVYMPWLASHKIIDISHRTADERCKELAFDDSLCARTDFNDSGWQSMKIPTEWESTDVGTFDGTVWFRKKIEIPKTWLHKNLVLELGPIDDFDLTFVNGKRVGGLETGSPWDTKRVYDVPAEIVTDSVLTIAVRVIDLLGGGGLWGQPEQLFLHTSESEEKISLVGDWKYLPIAEYRDSKFYLFDIVSREFYKRPPLTNEINAALPTVLYNGMIAPLIPYSIKGAIWYQGEANTDKPEAYETLFPLMIKNWRTDWKSEFPFYYVQIAPFPYGDRIESQRLRDAQFHALAVPKTGMAVTLDISELRTIHPRNKQDVGGRLARWALAKDYKKKIPFSGPLYTSSKIKNNAMILSFEYADGLKIIPKNGKTNFFIAGKDSVFKDANVIVKGKTVVVNSPEVKNPIAVRYTWGNTLEGTLFNKAGLPASTFRTDHWKK